MPLVIIFGLGIMFFWQKSQDLLNQIDDLEYENDDLKNQVEELETERDDAVSEKEEYKKIAQESITYYNERIREIREAYSNHNNNYSNTNSYNNSYSNSSKNNMSINIPSKLSRLYFDGGYLIEPSFGNLHNLMNLTMSDFRSKMAEYDYDLSTDGDSYISSGTTNCCYSINKEWNSVNMIFTKEIDSDIEVIMSQSNIDYTYDDGFKKYSYKIGYDSFTLYLKKNYQGVAIILKKH